MHKVLLVDDSPHNLASWRNVLSRPGVDIHTASNGVEALLIHQQQQVQVILTDMATPVMDGAQLCEAIRADQGLRRVSLLVASSTGRHQDRDRCMASGANAYLEKPVPPQELLRCVSRFVDIPARRTLRVLTRVDLKGAQDNTFLGCTVDISCGGMLAELDADLGVGDVITCRLALPDAFGVVTVDGEVVRLAPTDTGILKFGIRFVAPDPSTMAHIDAYVNGPARSHATRSDA